MLRNGELITSSGSLSHCLISYNSDSLLLFCQICPVIASFAPVAKWKPLVLHIHKHISDLWTYYFSGFVSSGCLTQDFPSYQRPLSLCPPSHLCLLDLGLMSFLSVMVYLCKLKWCCDTKAQEQQRVTTLSSVSRWAFGVVTPPPGGEGSRGLEVRRRLGSSSPAWDAGSWCWEVDWFTDRADGSSRPMMSHFSNVINDAMRNACLPPSHYSPRAHSIRLNMALWKEKSAKHCSGS